MEDQKVQYEVAKLAKSKGFNIYQPTQFSHGVNPTTIFHYSEDQCKMFNDTYYIPTQSLLKTWLRKKFNIHVEVILIDTLVNIYVYHISTTGNGIKPDSIFYNSYEEALECGLLECLNMLS